MIQMHRLLALVLLMSLTLFLAENPTQSILRLITMQLREETMHCSHRAALRFQTHQEDYQAKRSMWAVVWLLDVIVTPKCLQTYHRKWRFAFSLYIALIGSVEHQQYLAFQAYESLVLKRILTWQNSILVDQAAPNMKLQLYSPAVAQWPTSRKGHSCQLAN
jgi:hypothetical protein